MPNDGVAPQFDRDDLMMLPFDVDTKKPPDSIPEVGQPPGLLMAI
jgi:hypothetical protein